MHATDSGDEYARAVAAEVRAMLGRRLVQGKRLAARLGVSQMYVSRRIRGDLPWDVADLARVADVLDCEVSDLLPPIGTAHTRQYRHGVVSMAHATLRERAGRHLRLVTTASNRTAVRLPDTG